jgi:hypothetical protein
MADSSGIAVTVAPTQSAYFSGEQFEVTITFTNLNEPSTSYAHHFLNHHGSTPTSVFTPSHRRAARSVISFPASLPHTPRTSASFLSSAALPGDFGQEDDVYPLRRRGLVGKGKQREKSTSIAFSEPQITPPNGISQFKRKHIRRSLSVSGYSSEAIADAQSPLPKVDTGQLDTPLTDCE